MRSISLALLGGALALSTGFVAACPDGGHARRAEPPVPLTPPSRELVWGDVNIIHTTDSHGWLLGHQKTSFPEPNYSGDFGDFASFVAHMKKIAEEKDVDFLLADTGDLHDGTGLTDGYPSGGVNAHDSNKFFEHLPYDVLAIGNHELYNYTYTRDMYLNFVPKFAGRYLSSNVDITIEHPNGTVVKVPVGSRYAKFKTRKGRKVTSLGVLFNFTGNDHNTTVQPVGEMVNEAWFADAIKEEPDFFLLLGHMPVSRDNWPIVFNAIRGVHPTTPILILGGHAHIRDCVQFDGRSIALGSGRYMETVGFLSVDLDPRGSTKNLTVNRRYLDPNRVTYEFHTKRIGSNFNTNKGIEITKGLNELAQRFDLNIKYGTAPQDYTLTRNPYPSNGSALSLIVDQVLPTALGINNPRADIPNIIIINSGSLRFDIFSGSFTKNDQLTASPFINTFQYIAGVPLGIAKAILPILNGEGLHKRGPFEQDVHEAMLYARGDVEGPYRRWLAEMQSYVGLDLGAAQDLTPGIVTRDSCPGEGDDTRHTPLPFFKTPDYISTAEPTGSDDTTIDLVFVKFIAEGVLKALNNLQKTREYTSADILLYSPVLSHEMLGVFAQAKWN
ncbi:Metallo-dependent phosphatase-like protein [Russula compacta]|nr:Metallo-dependent phosphatase-like protein [Russula compacta]